MQSEIKQAISKLKVKKTDGRVNEEVMTGDKDRHSSYFSKVFFNAFLIDVTN